MVENIHPRPLLRHQLIHRPLRRPSPLLPLHLLQRSLRYELPLHHRWFPPEPRHPRRLSLWVNFSRRGTLEWS
ncbi:hypothetical protein LINPERPRIM_LOCUS31774 [Linum perenne]